MLIDLTMALTVDRKQILYLLANPVHDSEGPIEQWQRLSDLPELGTE
jgi:hypothetical protein